MKYSRNIILKLVACVAVAAGLQSCDDTKSYSDLLKEEEHAVNWYMAEKNVSVDIPEGLNFTVGPDAPFYKMDKDGYVYMQIVDRGDMDNRPVVGDMVYFRFNRRNIKELFEGQDSEWQGNGDDLNSTLGNTNLIFGNTVLSSTTIYGEGIQVPLKYVGYNSEVNLVIKSPEGFTTDATSCTPYIYNVKYFKAEY